MSSKSRQTTNARETFRRNAVKGAWGNGGIALLLLALGFGIIAWGASAERALNARSLTVEATVTDKTVEELYRASRFSDGVTVLYRLHTTFTDQAGSNVAAITRVSMFEYQNAEVGDLVQLRYDPQDPQLTMLAQTAPGFENTLVMVIGATLAVVGLWFVLKLADNLAILWRGYGFLSPLFEENWNEPARGTPIEPENRN